MNSTEFTHTVIETIGFIFDDRGYSRSTEDSSPCYTRAFRANWHVDICFHQIEHSYNFSVELMRVQTDAEGIPRCDADNVRTRLSTADGGKVEAQDADDAIWQANNPEELVAGLQLARWKLVRYALPWLELKLVAL